MSDPTAMEADKTKEEMTMATIIKQTKEEINWAEIARAREMGVLDKLLAERDVIRFNLRSGAEVAIMVEKVEPGRVWMGFVDGVAERPMYNRLARPVSWKESDTRKWCNTDLVQDLPEELVAIITPRTIRQTIKGEAPENDEHRSYSPRKRRKHDSFHLPTSKQKTPEIGRASCRERV